jgi:hypothetical protein
LAGSVKNPGGTFPDRLTCFRCVQRDFHFAFTHGTNILSGESIPRDARPRHESSRSVFDRFWMSLDPAPTLLCVRKGRAVGSVCDSRAKYFFELSTHTIVYLQSHVHNRDIATSVKSFLQRDVASFSARRCGGPRRSLRRNGRPHRLLKQKPRHRCRGFAFLAYRLEWLDGNPFRACRRSALFVVLA